ncbi:hypothetical protein [Myceligenerans pegani]|uniref:DUF4064 domain-containing protein n=1 Tax=Myceligenerans pegani TaxID=2776917 RepID=A0ABR9MV42_9MICO|nr:hypothetical protein [Myceligenerans sp. TRM 65318]MBE1875253.1 hypothetical protein [Myceligenerans sp. TRM 65318]MBE3017524.1 hypothetical protein [Myceligenerans sp. TRM 65318]
MARPTTTADAPADAARSGRDALPRRGEPAGCAEAVSTAGVLPPRRTVEVGSAVAGMVLSGLFLGGFSVVMNQIGEDVFRDSLHPEMAAAGIDLSTAGDPYTVARTLAAWFGFTLMGVLALGSAGVYAAQRSPERRATGWLLAAAGLVCLVGSQLILYPVAFLFFVGAGLFALRDTDRRPETRSPR